MKQLILLFTVLALLMPLSVQAASTPQKLRPNAGIGILLLPVSTGLGGEKPEPLFLYREPAISRLGELNDGTIPPYEWIFGMSSSTVPLIVTARKGNWLKVVCDDAGREAWLILQRQGGVFHTWESFFKGKVGRLLTGVRKQYCQLFMQPGQGASTVLNPKKSFKIIKIEDDWALVMLPDQNSLNWLRWRDEEGRLLIGLERLILLKHS